MMGMVDPMNANDMFDYAFGQFDGPAREQTEVELAADPTASDKVDRLSRAIHQLLDDGESYTPPIGLAGRTVVFVTESTRRRRTILDFVPRSVPFRPADVAVAAGILITSLLTLAPAVQKSRERMEVAGCGYNLQQLGRALWLYGSQHHHYPFAPEKDPKAPTGAYVAMLCDDGYLSQSELQSLDCPCKSSGKEHGKVPDFRTLCRLQNTNPELARKMVSTDYAYNVGYQNPATGRVQPIAALHSARVPLLADQPPHANLQTLRHGNSPNHGGRGQNVLYSDLHYGWHNTRQIGPLDADMYLNADFKSGPGLSEHDSALLPYFVPSLGY